MPPVKGPRANLAHIERFSARARAHARPSVWRTQSPSQRAMIFRCISEVPVQGAAHGIAQRPLDLELDHESVSTVHLHGIERGFDQRFADEELDDRPVERRVALMREPPRRSIEQRARRLDRTFMSASLCATAWNFRSPARTAFASWRISLTYRAAAAWCRDVRRRAARAPSPSQSRRPPRRRRHRPKHRARRKSNVLEHELAHRGRSEAHLFEFLSRCEATRSRSRMNPVTPPW